MGTLAKHSKKKKRTVH